MIFIGLLLILTIVLLAPFSVRIVEEELEIFLFLAGCIAITLTSQWSLPLISQALLEPLKITCVVFLAGFLFKFLQEPIARNLKRIVDQAGVKLFVFLLIVTLGLLSSVITAIVAALILVEIIPLLKLERKNEITLVILTCFSIGLGASLTPIGEPLSTIAIAKLKGTPYYAGFFFLFRHLWLFIIPAVFFFGLLGAILIPAELKKVSGIAAGKEESLKSISIRATKIYLFVVALVLLGRGFRPIIEAFILRIPHQGLYWLNIVSAVVDNATLAAAEIDPNMALLQIRSALLGLLISGGMLIPGNIPNIICAGKLKIKSSEWARVGLPLGLAVMVVYFFCAIY